MHKWKQSYGYKKRLSIVFARYLIFAVRININFVFDFTFYTIHHFSLYIFCLFYFVATYYTILVYCSLSLCIRSVMNHGVLFIISCLIIYYLLVSWLLNFIKIWIFCTDRNCIFVIRFENNNINFITNIHMFIFRD